MKGIFEGLHHLVVIPDMYIVIDTNQLVPLVPDSLYGLLRLHHEREHLRVLIRVVRLEIRLANLPCAEKLRRQILLTSERVSRSLLKFRSACRPDMTESGFQIRLCIMRNP